MPIKPITSSPHQPILPILPIPPPYRNKSPVLGIAAFAAC